MKPEHKAALDSFLSAHNGQPLDRKALLKSSPMVRKILIARIAELTPEQVKSMKVMVSPATASALRVLVPELTDLIDKGVEHGG